MAGVRRRGVRSPRAGSVIKISAFPAKIVRLSGAPKAANGLCYRSDRKIKSTRIEGGTKWRRAKHPGGPGHNKQSNLRWAITLFAAFTLAAVCAALLTLGAARPAESARHSADNADETAKPRSKPSRHPNSILGRPIYNQREVARYARSAGGTKYILKAIPHYYKLAPRVGIAPDVLVAQAMLETGYGRYGGDSRPWNMAGIKKGGNVGDAPRDFERPRTAYEGVRMHVNHMAAYTGKKPIGKPHDRFHDARAAQKSRGYWVRRISQLGGGVWATDPHYAKKIRRILNKMD
ncbi:MAG: glucosaminidase domain-containing protein [Rubrobacteraceae bacterium]